MCGIAGYFNFSGRKIQSNHQIVRMLEAQKHRGPDDSGIRLFSLENKSSEEIPHRELLTVSGYYEGALGFNRLSILDLSFQGHQPMSSVDGNVILCLNGEVYNAFDFKDELVKDGFSFRSTTDTEVVLNLYLKYGFDGMIKKLNGMFAIVIVDLRTSEVILARDRFGIKPLYFVSNKNFIAFSSELKSFYSIEDFSPSLNIAALDEYVLFRGVVEDTLINEIRSLGPGCSIRFNKKGGLSNKKFFDINDFNRSPGLGNEKDFGEFVKDVLRRSVKSQLLSDVKVGCQLSGGVDSSIVASMAKDLPGQRFESFSITFQNKLYSEEKYIDYVSEKLRLTAHKFELPHGYYLDNIAKVTSHLETPINHPNTVGLFLLSQQAKQFVTVLLSGEGADEIFGGYARFRDVTHRYNKAFFRNLVRFPDNAWDFIKWYVRPDHHAVISSAFVPFVDAKRLMQAFSVENAISKRIDLYKSFSGSVFDRQVKYELSTYLQDLLIRQDKMSMAHSIENRVPFLDNNLVAASFVVPEKLMIQKGRNKEKYLLKEIGSSIFDKGFVYRNKVGFGVPLKDIFKQRKFHEIFNDIVLPGVKAKGLFKHVYVESLFKNLEHLNYKQIEVLWLVVAFEFWYDAFLGVNRGNFQSTE